MDNVLTICAWLCCAAAVVLLLRALTGPETQASLWSGIGILTVSGALIWTVPGRAGDVLVLLDVVAAGAGISMSALRAADRIAARRA